MAGAPTILVFTIPTPPSSTLFPYTTLFRSIDLFANDTSPTPFAAGKTFRITASFSDGSIASTDRSEEHTSEPHSHSAPERRRPRQNVTVKVAGPNFQSGAHVGFGADTAAGR